MNNQDKMHKRQKVKKLSREELATISATSKHSDAYRGRRPRVLLLKPYQDSPTLFFCPPLALLCLTAALREKFGDDLVIDVIDMKLHRRNPDWLLERLAQSKPDVVGVSALNYEATVSHRIAQVVHQWDRRCITAIGGPYALHQSRPIFNASEFDWVFEGTSDRTFPEAVARHMLSKPLGTDLPGFSWRTEREEHVASDVDVISDLDALPIPAWDLCEFDLYAKAPTFNPISRAERYSVLFTSRGCPYLCSYCHDIFTKKYKWQSADRVISEIEHLYNTYGVREFQIVDDIFNLHKPRVLEIMNEVHRRWPGELSFSFPNGLRADILDQEVIDAMVRAGTYFTALAVETVTPRLQNMIEKYLDVDRTRWAIDEFERQGVTVAGFFMLGFPTETEEELGATVRFARESRLSITNFFSVVPQPGTPLYEQARREGPAQLEIVSKNEMQGGSYRNSESWYSLTYDFDLDSFLRKANWQTYAKPSRILKLLWRWPKKGLLLNTSNIMSVLIPGWGKFRQRKFVRSMSDSEQKNLTKGHEDIEAAGGNQEG